MFYKSNTSAWKESPGRNHRYTGLCNDYGPECLKRNVSHIRNIKGYLLAALFNAPATISSYYDALIRHNRSKPYDV